MTTAGVARCEYVCEVDAFRLHAALSDVFGAGRVFLLDAGQDTGQQYRMSLLGVVPVLEVQVKDGDVAIFALDGLDTYIADALKGRDFVESVDHGRTNPSVVSAAPALYRATDPMAVLETIRQAVRRQRTRLLPPFTSGLFGYIGYDAVRYVESLPQTTEDDLGVCDIRLQWPAAVIQLLDGRISVFDSLDVLRGILHADAYRQCATEIEQLMATLERCCRGTPALAVPTVAGDSAADGPTVVEDVTMHEFVRRVLRVKEYISTGDVFQVVLSKRMRVAKREHHYLVYDRLRRVNPSPYMFMAEYPDMRLFGASPEVQFRCVGGRAEMRPIAGTSKGRGRTQAEDEALLQALVQDAKERAEHVMLVDLCRNDLGRVCRTGTVSVSDFLRVERYSHMFHLVSTVTGELRPDVSVFHALVATFPAGTLSGAPKIRAMEIIDELETHRRGPYGGLIGVIDFDANANTAIVIRSVLEVRDTYNIQTGAGIVADSDPVQEWLECGHKAGALLDVLRVPRP